jgi:hypothetical protein
VSSDFDFFAGRRTPPTTAASPWAPATASAWAPAAQPDQRFGSAISEWQPISTPPTGQFAPTVRSSRRPFVIVAALVLIAAAGGAFYISQRTHPVSLPSTLAGMQRVSVPSAEAHDLDSAKHSLANDGLHDVSFGIYGSVSAGQPGLVVIAGRTSSSAPAFNQLTSAMGQAGQVAGISVTPQTVTSGATTLQCATVTAAGQSVPFCEWQGAHAVLFGVGQDMSAQDTADALESARLDASLH